MAKKILVAEDEAITALSLRMWLKTKGYVVCKPVSTGEGAIREAIKERPHLIIIDIGLPGSINGIVAAKKIHSYHKIPIIFITGYFGEGLGKELRGITPSTLLTKPFSPSDIERVIQKMLPTSPKGLEQLEQINPK